MEAVRHKKKHRDDDGVFQRGYQAGYEQGRAGRDEAYDKGFYYGKTYGYKLGYADGCHSHHYTLDSLLAEWGFIIVPVCAAGLLFVFMAICKALGA